MSADFELLDGLRFTKASSVEQFIIRSHSRGSFFISSSTLRSISSFDRLSPKLTIVAIALRSSSSVIQYSDPAESLTLGLPRGLVPMMSSVCEPVMCTSQRSCASVATAPAAALAGTAALAAFDPAERSEDLLHAASASASAIHTSFMPRSCARYGPLAKPRGSGGYHARSRNRADRSRNHAIAQPSRPRAPDRTVAG